MPSTQKAFGLFACIMIPLMFGLFFDSFGMKFVAVIGLAIVAGAILLAPMKYAIFMALAFISIQGFLKVISNYHPLIHLGADLVVIALVAKTVILRVTGMVDDKIKLPPLSALFALHFAWVFIVYFNPYSLGFVASIAGSKIYVSMILMYFFGYYLINNKKDLHQMMAFFVGLTLLHTLFTVAQGFLGPASVTSLHPFYGVQLAKYQGQAFRPFGLTQLPGGPSVYIYTALTFMLYGFYHFRSTLFRFAVMFALPLAGLALMMCQVRSAIIKGIIALGIYVLAQPLNESRTLYPSLIKRALIPLSLLAVSVFVIGQLMNVAVDEYQDNRRAFERSLTSFSYDTMKDARRNSFDRFLSYASKVPLGAGFSRVGASAGYFRELKKADPYFQTDTFFADNFFITLVVELGIPGLLIMLTLIAAIFWKGFDYIRKNLGNPRTDPQIAILATLFAIFLGSYSGEGMIYNPESCFFWLFSGILIKLQSPDFDAEGL